GPERREDVGRTGPQGLDGPGHLRTAGTQRGRTAGELPCRSTGADGLRLATPAVAEPGTGLLRHLRLRADRPDEPGPRLRPDRAGAVGDDEHHRYAGHRAAAGRLPGQ